MDPLIIIAIVVVVALLAFTVAVYNGLVRKRNVAEQSWADVDAELTRRSDLIGNLVETVKGYASHEQTVLTDVTRARAQAVGAGSVGDRIEAEGMLTSALRSLFAVAEAYPDLKADANFRQLQEELATTENRLSGARRQYNAAVQVYDTGRETFPAVLVAGMFGFGERPYFELDDPQGRDAPRVEF